MRAIPQSNTQSVRPTAGAFAASERLQLEPPTLSEAWTHDAPAPLWTPRSLDRLQCFFPLFAAPTAGAFAAPLSDCVPAAKYLQEYLPAALRALVADPTKPLPFLPPTDDIAVYLLPRVTAWAAAVEPRAGVAPILAGCEQRVRTLEDADLLQPLIRAARAGGRAPSDEIFVRCNLLMDPEAGGSPLEWLTAEDAHWLLQHPCWAPEASCFLATRAGEAPSVERGLAVSRPSLADLLCFLPWAAPAHPGLGQGPYGVLRWPNGTTYTGTLVRGRCHGWGRRTNASSLYEGEFKDGLPNGRGVKTFASGYRIQGEFKNDRATGPCVVTYGNGDRFEVAFKDGGAHGWGIRTFANGDRFAGEFKNGRAHGPCTLTFAHGESHGESHGDCIRGEFLDGRAMGHGSRTFASGDLIYGTFKDGGANASGVVSFVKSDRAQQSGKRALRLPDGSSYKQTLVNGRIVQETQTRPPVVALPFRIAAGAIVDATDKNGDRCLARVHAVLHDGAIRVGFCGFSAEADETIPAAEVEQRVTERDTRATRSDSLDSWDT